MDPCGHFRKKRNGLCGSCWNLLDNAAQDEYHGWWTNQRMEQQNYLDEKQNDQGEKRSGDALPRSSDSPPAKRHKKTDNLELTDVGTMELFERLDFHNKQQQGIIDELKRRRSIM